MLDCLTTLKKEIPELEMAYYKQDNTGCYHSGNSSCIGEYKPDDMLFPGPEEGCVTAYSRFANLQTHLDTGKPQMMPGSGAD